MWLATEIEVETGRPIGECLETENWNCTSTSFSNCESVFSLFKIPWKG